MKLLVIRGDLQSHSGYSAAARDYCRQLRSLFDRIAGVDIHHSAARPFEPFPFPLLSEGEAKKIVERAGFALVLSFTTPDHYTRYPHARNVGLTFWETDRLPLQGRERSPWADMANAMDALWLPSTHTKNVFEKAGVIIPTRVVPWPIEIPSRVGEGLPDGEVYNLDRESVPLAALASVGSFREDRFGFTRRLGKAVGPPSQVLFLRRLRASGQRLAGSAEKSFLCVAQDVPRKGLLLFLSEWMEFKRLKEGQPWRLILKTSPIDPHLPSFDFVLRFWSHVRALKRQLRVPRAEVFLWVGDVAVADFHRLVANSYGLIAPSLGEGFCGPAALALGLGKPLVAPRHSAFADYLSASYPYSFDSRPVHVSFVDDPLRVYDPASVWNVPVPYALSETLRKVTSDPPERQKEVCWRACGHFNNWCGAPRVKALLAEEIERLMAQAQPAAA
jgi:hypothetical protein